MIKEIFCLALLVVFTACGSQSDTHQNDSIPLDTLNVSEDTIPYHYIIYGVEADSLNVEQTIVKRGDNFGKILDRFGITGQQRIAAIDSISTKLKPQQLRAGGRLTIMSEQDSVSTTRHIVYDIDPQEYMIVSFNSDNSVSCSVVRREIKQITKTSEGVIETSLWNAVVGQGLQWELAQKLSDIYAWNVDFFGLQKGDMFRVRYVERWADTSYVGIDSIECAIFRCSDVEIAAIPFNNGDRTEFFDEEGQSLRKAFLKAPLKYSRISSSFSHSRFHPVLKIRRPHHGVDYAAPYGTPIMTIGDGTVVAKGYDKKGGGNFVRVRHNSEYETVYMHMKSFAKGIQKGTRVQMSQIIGYVGATGTATGPHLDFRVYHHGHAIDPLKMQSPPAEPVKEELLPKFMAVRDSLLTLLSEDCKMK